MVKKIKIKSLISQINKGKLNEVLQLADATFLEDLFQVGILYRQKRDYLFAEKIFNRILQINPEFAEA